MLENATNQSSMDQVRALRNRIDAEMIVVQPGNRASRGLMVRATGMMLTGSLVGTAVPPNVLHQLPPPQPALPVCTAPRPKRMPRILAAPVEDDNSDNDGELDNMTKAVQAIMVAIKDLKKVKVSTTSQKSRASSS